MTNTEGVVLKLLMHSKNSEQALLAFSRIKEKHFTESYKPIYLAIRDFYEEFSALPTFNDLKISKGRSARVQTILGSIEPIDINDLELDVAVEALLDTHSQDVALDLITDFIESISLLNRDEMQEHLSRMPIMFEESVEAPELVLTTQELTTFKSKEDISAEEVLLGLSNKWDSEISNRLQELVLYGGRRGSGKSILCANATVNQMNQGNVGVYFTIEMTADETFQRILSIATGVSHTKIKNSNLDVSDTKSIATWLANQYHGSENLLKEFKNHIAPDPFEFEKKLKSTCKPKDEGKLVIVDDRDLSLASIDVQFSKLKSKYGDRFKVAVIDYINQVVWDGHEADMYDWKTQTIIAKQLKNLARKYNICILSPYQMDNTGEARFSKGILDACDTAQLIEPDKETSTLTLVPTKVRGGSDEIYTTVPIDWNCLKIHPEEVNIEELRKDEDDNSFPSGAGELT